MLLYISSAYSLFRLKNAERYIWSRALLIIENNYLLRLCQQVTDQSVCCIEKNKVRYNDIVVFIYKQMTRATSQNPGDSIRLVDPTGHHRIPRRITLESDEFHTNTDRIRYSFCRIPIGRNPRRITPEKDPTGSDRNVHRKSPDPIGYHCWKTSEQHQFHQGSRRISSDIKSCTAPQNYLKVIISPRFQALKTYYKVLTLLY